MLAPFQAEHGKSRRGLLLQKFFRFGTDPREFKFDRSKHFHLALSPREVYVKGPGLIFKGNPKNYLMEIQLPFNTSLTAEEQ